MNAWGQERKTEVVRHQGPMSWEGSELIEALERITEMSITLKKCVPGRGQQEKNPKSSGDEPY